MRIKTLILTSCILLLFCCGCSRQYYMDHSTKNPTIDKPCQIWFRVVDKIPPRTIIYEDAFGEMFDAEVSSVEYKFIPKKVWFLIKIGKK